jgi:hypothetical protein
MTGTAAPPARSMRAGSYTGAEERAATSKFRWRKPIGSTPMDGIGLSAAARVVEPDRPISITTDMTQLLEPAHAKVAADSVGVNVRVKTVLA